MFSLPYSSARAFTRFWFSRSIAPADVQTKHSVAENTISTFLPAKIASMAPPGFRRGLPERLFLAIEHSALPPFHSDFRGGSTPRG